MDGARGIGRFIRGEVDRELRDFLRSTEPADGLPGFERDSLGDRVVGSSTKACRISLNDLPRSLAWVEIRASSEGDSIVPGQMALARMPRRMKSAATALVRPITAALLAP